MDFIQLLGPDLSIKVFSCLDDPGDLVRVSAVCSSWEHFVMENGLCKKLCLKMIPDVSGVVPRIEKFIIDPDRDKHKYYYTKWERLKRNHKVYANLAFGFTPRKNNCISHCTDVSLFESNSYESLVYRLCSNLCLVTEINIQPFLAYYDNGLHNFSTKAVRFRLGYRRRGEEIESMIGYDKTLNFRRKFCWTYTSPTFPISQLFWIMVIGFTRASRVSIGIQVHTPKPATQENKLHTFKLPKPVLCVGGVLLVELFVQGQRVKVDNFYHSWSTWYQCESHVEVVA